MLVSVLVSLPPVVVFVAREVLGNACLPSTRGWLYSGRCLWEPGVRSNRSQRTHCSFLPRCAPAVGSSHRLVEAMAERVDYGGQGRRALPLSLCLCLCLCLWYSHPYFGLQTAGKSGSFVKGRFHRSCPPPPINLAYQVVLDDLAGAAPPEMLQDVMLTVIFPLARHTWDVAAFGRTPPQRWNHHDQPSSSSSTQPLHRRGQDAAASPPPQSGRQGVASTGRRHRAEHGDGGGGGGGATAAVPLEAAHEVEEGEEEEGEDGFEMVEAPNERGHSPQANAAASGPTLCREPSGTSGGGEEEGEGEGAENNDDGDDDSSSDGEVGLQQLSSPALLVLLLVLKTFLKHLSSLRRGGGFCDVWHEVSVGAGGRLWSVLFCS